MTLDEEDLRRLCNGTTPDMTTFHAYQILEAEAERLVYDKLVRRYGYDQRDGLAKINTLNDRVHSLVSAACGPADT